MQQNPKLPNDINVLGKIFTCTITTCLKFKKQNLYNLLGQY